MHRALTIVEVILETFAHLDPAPSRSCDDSDIHENVRMLLLESLAALARTCKTFYEPAMNLLWSCMYGLSPLFGCVPRLHPLIYDHNKGGLLSRWSHGAEPLSMHEAPLFLRHATRVRFLHLSSSYASYQDLHLLNVFIGTCVFPKLLALDCEKFLDTKFLRLFLSPTLRECILPVSYSDLGSIGTCCPILENLSTHIPSFCTTDELSLLSAAVRSSKRLVDIRCLQLDFAAWKHLANLPTLLKVDIQEREVRQPLGWDRLYFARFLNLTSLMVDVKESADIITILQHSEFPSLKAFCMDAFVLPWEMAEQLFCALSSCKASDTLECIKIASYSRSSNVELSNTPVTAIKQFLPFHRLRTLSLHLNHRIHLDNRLLLEATSSWPDIRELELVDMRDLDDYSPRLVTFHGLSKALRMCPRLHSLQLPMNAVLIDISISVDTFRHTSLQRLGLEADIGDPLTVAGLIFTMFPSVERVEDYGDSSWLEVNRLLRSLIALKKVASS